MEKIDVQNCTCSSPNESKKRKSTAEDVAPEHRLCALQKWIRTGEAGRFDKRLMDTIGLAALDPDATERFVGEARALTHVVLDLSPHRSVETCIIGRCVEALWMEVEFGGSGEDGTRASRLQLLRAFATFLLHDEATWLAISDRDTVKETIDFARRGVRHVSLAKTD